MLESCVIPGAHSYVLGSLPSGLILIRLSGTCLALLPTTATAASPIYIAVFEHFRYSSLASVTAAFVLPALVYLIKEPNAVSLMPFLCVLLSLAFVKHHENIRRRLSGTESRFLQK